VDLERARGQEERGAVVQTALQHAPAGHALLEPAARRPGRSGASLRRDDLLPGRHDVEALREKIGNDATFFRIMRDEAQQNRFGTVTTPGFIATAERDSGLDLAKFFQAWLFTPGKPTAW
jgi:hypothetical protein